MNTNKLITLKEHLQDLDDSVEVLKKSYENYISFFRLYNLQDYPTSAVDGLWQKLEDLNNSIALETFRLQSSLPTK